MDFSFGWSGRCREAALGRDLLERGEFERAARCFEGLIGGRPVARAGAVARLAGEARAELGLSRFHLGADAAAEDAFATSLAWDPERPHVRVFRARVLARAGRVREAIDELERVAAGGDADADAWMLIAKCRHDAGHGGLASAALDRALALAIRDVGRLGRSLAPSCASATAGRAGPLGFLLRRAESGPVSELERVARAVAERPGYPDRRLKLAAAWLRAGEPGHAERELEEALRLNPRYLEAWALRMRVRLWRGDSLRAAAGFERLIATGPDYPDLLFHLAVARIHAGEAHLATAPLERAVDLNRHFARAHRLLGLLHHGFGRHAEALRSLRRGLQRDRELAVPTLDALRPPSPQGAAPSLERAVARTPHYPDLHLALARRHSRQGELERARESCVQALVLHPGFDAAALERARLDLELGRLASAERALEDLTERHPDWPDAHALLGRARRSRGNPCGAAEALRRALRLNPGLPAVREDLAWALQSSVGSSPEEDEEADAALGEAVGAP